MKLIFFVVELVEELQFLVVADLVMQVVRISVAAAFVSFLMLVTPVLVMPVWFDLGI